MTCIASLLSKPWMILHRCYFCDTENVRSRLYVMCVYLLNTSLFFPIKFEVNYLITFLLKDQYYIYKIHRRHRDAPFLIIGPFLLQSPIDGSDSSEQKFS